MNDVTMVSSAAGCPMERSRKNGRFKRRQHWASSHDRDTSEASDVANQLKRVTPAEFAAAAKGLSLGRAVLALRGPADKLKEPLAKLGLAPASVTADETEPVKP